MKIDIKKKLAARVLGVGKEKIVFNNARLEEIKEAITRQDIKNLFEDGAISIKEKRGKMKIVKRKWRRKHGKIKKVVGVRKRKYITNVRKQRAFIKLAKNKKIIDNKKYRELRSKIKTKAFKSLSHLKEGLR